MFTTRFSAVHYILLFVLVALLAAALFAAFALALDGPALELGAEQVQEVSALNTCPSPRNWSAYYPDLYRSCLTR